MSASRHKAMANTYCSMTMVTYVSCFNKKKRLRNLEASMKIRTFKQIYKTRTMRRRLFLRPALRPIPYLQVLLVREINSSMFDVFLTNLSRSLATPYVDPHSFLQKIRSPVKILRCSRPFQSSSRMIGGSGTFDNGIERKGRERATP